MYNILFTHERIFHAFFSYVSNILCVPNILTVFLFYQKACKSFLIANIVTNFFFELTYFILHL